MRRSVAGIRRFAPFVVMVGAAMTLLATTSFAHGEAALTGTTTRSDLLVTEWAELIVILALGAAACLATLWITSIVSTRRQRLARPDAQTDPAR